MTRDEQSELATLLTHEASLPSLPETADSVRRARELGPEATPVLMGAIGSGGLRGLLALEGLRAADPAAYESLPAGERAQIYADALREGVTFNAWGLPGMELSGTAHAAIALGAEAVEAFAPLLDDGRPAPLLGSQEATTSRMYGNRVRDYAWAIVSEILGEEYRYDEDPADRDRQIDALRARLAA